MKKKAAKVPVSRPQKRIQKPKDLKTLENEVEKHNPEFVDWLRKKKARKNRE